MPSHRSPHPNAFAQPSSPPGAKAVAMSPSLILAGSKRRAAASIFSSVASNSGGVPRWKRSGLIRATTKDFREAFDVRLGQIALERGGHHALQRQHGQQVPVPTQRIAVLTQGPAALGFDALDQASQLAGRRVGGDLLGREPLRGRLDRLTPTASGGGFLRGLA